MMHRAILAILLLNFSQLHADDEAAKQEKLLPKPIEFELSLWQSRLGLQKRHIRELRYAAGKAVAERKKAMKAAEEDEDFAGGDPWDPFKTEAEPWVSISLPPALKAKSFTEVAEKVLGEQHLANLKRLKDHAKETRRTAKQNARIHIRISTMSKKLALTEGQQKKIVTLLTKRGKAHRELALKFKGREDEIPQAKPLREDPEFLAIIDANQKKRLEKRPEVPDQEL